MKKYKIILLITVFICFPAISQTYGENSETEVKSENVILSDNEVTPFTLANLGINTAPNPKNSIISGNSVFVRQVGDFNQTSIETNTNSSEINLLQNGNSNYTKLDYTANTAVADLIQNGNNNVINDFAITPTLDISLDLVQEGDNLTFVRDGANDLTKSLKFRQSEASPTLIIRSFN